MPTVKSNDVAPYWWALADTGCVMLFVVMGRMNHAEGLTLGGVFSTALPFLLALGLAWTTPLVNRNAASSVAGLIVWAVVIVVGMLLRRFLFGDGIALSFIAVATVFLGVSFNGWRALARAVLHSRKP